jgi:hypothetical protein
MLHMICVKNRIHGVLHANLIAPYEGNLFTIKFSAWLLARRLLAGRTFQIGRRGSGVAGLEDGLPGEAAPLHILEKRDHGLGAGSKEDAQI